MMLQGVRTCVLSGSSRLAQGNYDRELRRMGEKAYPSLGDQSVNNTKRSEKVVSAAHYTKSV